MDNGEMENVLHMFMVSVYSSVQCIIDRRYILGFAISAHQRDLVPAHNVDSSQIHVCKI